MKKISLLCGLLGLSLSMSNVYAGTLYNGDINVYCSFTMNKDNAKGFGDYVKQHKKIIRPITMYVSENDSEYDFNFWAKYQSNSEILSIDFIDGIIKHYTSGTNGGYDLNVTDYNHNISRSLTFYKKDKPIFEFGIGSYDKAFTSKVVLDYDNYDGSDNKLKASFLYDYNYNLKKWTGIMRGTCNFVGIPYTSADSEKEEPVGPDVVIHTKEM